MFTFSRSSQASQTSQPSRPSAPLSLICSLGLASLLVACGGGSDSSADATEDLQKTSSLALASTATTTPDATAAPRCAQTGITDTTSLTSSALGTASAKGQPIPLCYGTATWREPTLDGRWLDQSIHFYPATSAPTGTPAPLVVWAHPNGMSKNLPTDSPTTQALLPPALAAGYAFASVEFRHPVTNATSTDNGQVPHTDLIDAVRYLQRQGAKLNIDPQNVFLVGQSRGTLGIWGAVQTPPLGHETERVRAVFAFQAQTTYDGVEFANTLLIPQDRPTAIAQWKADNPLWAQYGSAVQDASADDPPVLIRYRNPVIPRLISLSEMDTQGGVHHPNFGPLLCAAYQKAGAPKDHCQVQTSPSYTDPKIAYAGYVDFFNQFLVR